MGSSGGPPVFARPTRKRRLLRGVLILFGLLTAMLLVVTQSGLLKVLVQPAVEAFLGARVHSGRTRVDAGGVLVIETPALDAARDDLPATAARFVEADQLRISVDWWALLRGKVRIERVELVKPVIRISQGEDLTLNIKGVFDRLSAQVAGGAGPGPAPAPNAPAPPGGVFEHLPELYVGSGMIELGEHTSAAGGGGTYQQRTSLSVSGSITPSPDKPGQYVVTFYEEKGAAGDAKSPRRIPGLGSPLTAPRMQMQGHLELSPLVADLKLTNVDLGELGRRQAPRWMEKDWGAMGLGGTIPVVAFGYSSGKGLELAFDVKDADLKIPIPVEADWDAEGNPTAPAAQAERRPLAMQGVTGRVTLIGRRIRAELKGQVEDFPATVTLQTEDRDLNSALSCTITSRDFLISKHPRLLPFAPPAVRFLFQRFGGPTARADMNITIRRGPPDADAKPGQITATGAVKFTNGTAAHDLFRYPVSQLAGTVQFDTEKVELLNIKGSNPNGAKLLATGTVSPPDETAKANIDVTVTDIPLDDLFLEALPEARKIVWETLFDRPTYDAMRREVLLQSAQDKQEREARLAELRSNIAMGDRFGAGPLRMRQLQEDVQRLEQEITAPVFELGGTAQMQVAVTRALGAEEETRVDVNLSCAKAGLLLKAFPLPVYAEGVELHLGGNQTTMKPIRLRSITGAAGTLSGHVDYPAPHTFFPWLDIDATGVGLDAFLLRALPDRAGSHADSPITARSFVRGMNFFGSADMHAIIRPDPDDPESATFRVDVGVSGASARPGSGGLAIDRLRGAVSVYDGAVEVPLLEGEIDGVPVALEGRAWYGGAGPMVVSGALRSPALDLSLPLDDLILPGAPETARRVRELRAQRLPVGCAAGEVAVVDDGRTPAASIRIDSLQGGEFAAADQRASLAAAHGRIEVTPQAAAFIGFSATGAYGTRAALEGTLALDDTAPSSLVCTASDARFEDPLVRAMAAMAGPEVDDFVRRNDPRGAFDARVKHDRNAAAPGSSDSSGWLGPRSLSLTRRGATVSLSGVRGRFTFTPEGGTLDHMEAHADTWGVKADGRFTLRPTRTLDMTLSLEGEALGKDLRAALPGVVADALESVELGEVGGFTMRDARLRIESGRSPAFDGSVEFHGITLKPVVPISGDGSVAIKAGDAASRSDPPRVTRKPGAPSAPVTLDIVADSFRLAGVAMTGGRARIELDPESGAVRVPLLDAAAHEGRLAAHGHADPPPSPGASGKPFEFTAELSNVRFGDLLADLYPKTVLDESAGKGTKPEVDRGRLDASFSLAGVLGNVNTRRGRGILRVQDGEVLNMPAVVPILKLSNLQPPTSERVGFGYAEFYVQGEKLRFDEFSLQSRSLAIDGRGTVSWPGLNVDMKFVTRSLARVPILTDLLEGVRDELVTTTVSGTLYDPQLKYEQLTATRQMLGEMFGSRKREEPPTPSSDQPGRAPEK